MKEKFRLSEDYIQFEEGFDTWEEAIIKGSLPLLKGGQIEESYISGMIESIKEHGPYIIIAPNIALPHARPELGSLEIGFSIMKTKKPVKFSGNNEATLFITLSCVDSDTHLDMLSSIVQVLSDPIKHDQLFDANNKEAIIGVFNN